MRSSPRVLMLALCLVALESTATADSGTGVQTDDVNGKLGGTKTITTEAQKPPGDNQDTLKGTGELTELIKVHGPVEEKGENTNKNDVTEDTAEEVLLPVVAATTTTTTTEIKKPTEGERTVTEDTQSSLTSGQNSQQTLTTGRDPSTRAQSLPEAGTPLQDLSLQKAKTATKAVSVSPAQPLPEVKEPEVDQRIVTEPQGKVAGNGEGGSTTKVQRDSLDTDGTQHQPVVQDSAVAPKAGNGQSSAPVAAKAAPALTTGKTESGGELITKTVSSTGASTAQTHTTTGTTVGEAKEKQSPAVTSPATTIAKKKEDHSEITPSTNSGQKETHTQQTLKATTTTEEQTVSAETTTTSTSAPLKTQSSATATTLPKGFKIPQSLDKMDVSCSTSLFFAFVTLVTLSVMSVAPVY